MRSLLIEFAKNDRLIANIYFRDKGYLSEALSIVKDMIDNYNKNLSNLDISMLDENDIIFSLFFLSGESKPNDISKTIPLMRERSTYKLLNLSSKYFFDKETIVTTGGVIAIEKSDMEENVRESEGAIHINFDDKKIYLSELTYLYDREFYEGMNNSARFKTCDLTHSLNFNEIEELIEINKSYKGWKTSSVIYEAIIRK